MIARRATWLAVLLLPVAMRAAAAEPPAPVPAPGGLNAELKLENVDQDLSDLRQAPWHVPEMLGHPAADETGRRVEDDLAEYVLTEPALARITTLRDALAASTTAGAAIPAAQSQPLQLLVQAQYCRVVVITSYWTKRRTREYHQGMIEALVGRFAEQDRPAALLALRSIEARATSQRALVRPGIEFCQGVADKGLPPAAALDLAIVAKDPLLEDYNGLRMKLAAQLNAARHAAGTDFIPVHRTTPCPAAAPATTTSGRRAIAIRSKPDVRDYYPAEALNFFIDGATKVRLLYDSTGCIVEASILESSGSDLLDEASIRVGFAYALTPGEEDGKPVAGGGVVLPINFRVQGLFPPGAGPAPQPQP